MLTTGHRSPQHLCDLGSSERLKFKDAAAAHEGRGESKKWILGRCSHQRDHAALHIWQQHILLGLVEAMDLIDEQTGLLSVVLQPSPSTLKDLAEFLHT